jgi:uncharacterized protein (TIGR02722 family)
MKKIITYSVMFGIIFFLGACASKVSYENPEQVETLTPEFGSTDLQMIAGKMVDSLLATPILQSGQRPVVYVHKVKNKTDEHLDTVSITDKIKVALIKSGKVKFSAVSEANDEILKQLEYQTSSGVVDPKTAKTFGSQIGADYFLYGEITSIKKKEGKTENFYYKMTMNLVNIKTGIIEWADEKEISKQAKKPIIGK